MVSELNAIKLRDFFKLCFLSSSFPYNSAGDENSSFFQIVQNQEPEGPNFRI